MLSFFFDTILPIPKFKAEVVPLSSLPAACPFSIRMTPRASVPYGTISNSFPAFIISRIRESPYRVGTASSYANSPEKEILNNLALRPPQTVICPQAMKGNPSFEISYSSSTIFLITFRLLGPAIAN